MELIPGMKILEKYPFEITRVIDEPPCNFIGRLKNWPADVIDTEDSVDVRSFELVLDPKLLLPGETYLFKSKEEYAEYYSQNSQEEKCHKTKPRAKRRGQTEENPSEDEPARKKRKSGDEGAHTHTENRKSILIMPQSTPSAVSRRRTLFSPENFENTLDFTILFGQNLESPVRKNP